MSLKKILLAISLMAVVAIMGSASACPCRDLAVDEWSQLVDQPVGTAICIQAPTPDSEGVPDEDWEYQWMVYEESTGWRMPTPAEIVDSSKICVTPTVDNCGEIMAVRVTIQTATDLDEGEVWPNCIRVLCVQWMCYNPECPDMTDFCQQEADESNLPTGESAGFTYIYKYNGAVVDLTGESWLNTLQPGEYVIDVYTAETGYVCSITIHVYAKPTGSLQINP